MEKLSSKLNEFAFKEHEDPINELDLLAEEAQRLETKVEQLEALTEMLGEAKVEEMLDDHYLATLL